MENSSLTNISCKIFKTLGEFPNDTVMIAQRVMDHAMDKRASPDDTSALLAALNYDSISDFCEEAGLPKHLAERWSRFGISNEMRQVIILMISQREKTKAAIEEFESMTHVGIDEFMHETGLI